MGTFLEKWFRPHRLKLDVILEIKVKEQHVPKPVHRVVICIPVHSLIINNKNVEIMANQFGKAQKVPYTLQGLDASGVPTTAPFTCTGATAGDGTVAKVVPNDSTFQTGFIFGVGDGSVSASFAVVDASNNPLPAATVDITISDAVIPPTPNPVASVGVVLGDAVAQ